MDLAKISASRVLDVIYQICNYVYKIRKLRISIFVQPMPRKCLRGIKPRIKGKNSAISELSIQVIKGEILTFHGQSSVERNNSLNGQIGDKTVKIMAVVTSGNQNFCLFREKISIWHPIIFIL